MNRVIWLLIKAFPSPVIPKHGDSSYSCHLNPGSCIMTFFRFTTIAICAISGCLWPIIAPAAPETEEQTGMALAWSEYQIYESAISEINRIDQTLDELEGILTDQKELIVNRLMNTETVVGMEEILQEITSQQEYSALLKQRRQQREKANTSAQELSRLVRLSPPDPAEQTMAPSLDGIKKIPPRMDEEDNLVRFIRVVDNIVKANRYLDEQSRLLYDRAEEKLNSHTVDELLYMWEDDFRIFAHEIKAITDQATGIDRKTTSIAKFNQFKKTIGKELFSHHKALSLDYRYDTLEDFLCQEAKDSYSRISTYFESRIVPLENKRLETAQKDRISWRAARFGKQTHYYGPLLQLTESDVVDGHISFTLTSYGSPAFFEVFITVNGQKIKLERQMTIVGNGITTVFHALLPVEGEQRQLQVKYGTGLYEDSRFSSNESILTLLLPTAGE